MKWERSQLALKITVWQFFVPDKPPKTEALPQFIPTTQDGIAANSSVREEALGQLTGDDNLLNWQTMIKLSQQLLRRFHTRSAITQLD